MVHIRYFSLLLLFISANIIDGMNITTFEARKFGTRKKELEKLPTPYLPGLESHYQQDDTDKFFESELFTKFLNSEHKSSTLQSKLCNPPQPHQPNNFFDQQIGKQSNSNFSSLKKKEK